MKISLFTKTYITKACYFFIIFLMIIIGTPTKTSAFNFGDFITSITGSKIQAAENTDYNGTDDFPNSQNMQLLGVDSLEPNKKNQNDCASLDIDDGALQMDNCTVGSGLESVSTGEMTSYVVKEGDTLSEIAAQFDVSLNTIRWENNITGNNIKVGQKLNILPVTGVKHIIKKGDTLEKIAAKYDAEVEDIKVFNGIDGSDSLKSEDVLYVPNGTKPVVVVAKPVIKKGTTVTPSGSNNKAESGYYIRPANGPTTSPYGSRRRGFHYGIDIGNARGTTVVASASGVVSEVLGSCREGRSSCGGRYGNYIVIEHPNGTRTRYAHLSKVSVSIGEQVGQGEQIGTIGNTGRSTGPHLHFQVEKSNGSTMRPSF